MVVYTKIINLTAEEVAKCSEEKNGIVSFITGKAAPGSNQMTYRDVFDEKLTEAVGGRATFIYKDSPRSTGIENMAFYVKCEHRRNDKNLRAMSVSWEKSNHKICSPLELKFNSLCDTCEGIESSVRVPVASTQVNSTTQFNAVENAEFVESFNAIKEGLDQVLTKIKNDCLQSENPLKHLRDNMATYGLDANSSLIKAIVNRQAAVSRQGSIVATSSTVQAPSYNITFSAVPSIVASSSPSTSTAPNSSPMVSTPAIVSTSSPSISTDPNSSPIVSTPAIVPTSSTATTTPITSVLTPTAETLSTPTTLGIITPILSVTPVIRRSLRSAERAVIQAATAAEIYHTPRTSSKRSARAFLAQKMQDDNIAKKKRGY